MRKIASQITILFMLTRFLIAVKSVKRKFLLFAALNLAVLTIAAYSFPPVTMIEKEPVIKGYSAQNPYMPESIAISQYHVKPEEQIEEEPEQLPLLDLSAFRSDIVTEMRQINEPNVWGHEMIYSAGSAANIDGPVLTRLIINDISAGIETEVAVSNVRFGEIYEGRINDRWVVWLDTNQIRTNHIYSLNRSTGHIFMVSDLSINRPQLALWGDFLAWTGQKEELKDELNIINLSNNKSIKLEDFDNPTFGTSSPAFSDNLLVWAYPHPEDPERSILKTLDVSTLNLAAADKPYTVAPPDQQSEMSGAATEVAFDIRTIDPDGFAIYPATNGRVIAWLDNLNPTQASLKITKDFGENILTVAQNVGRFFGVGDDFVVYTQQGQIMLYFWEQNRYAILTKEGEQAKLSEKPVSARTIIWYDATDPSKKQDIIKISILGEMPD